MPSECEDWPVEGYTPDASLPPESLQLAMQAAQGFLRGLTGNKLGVCTYNERFQVRLTTNRICAAAGASDNSCCAIELPHRPVQGVVAVLVDGVNIGPSNYELLGGRRLTRRGGCWPQSADNELGRVQVTYLAGIPLSEGSPHHAAAALAMGEVVKEYVNAFAGRPCKLPSRFVSVARQGVTTVAMNPSDFIKMGLTGMPLTDNLVNMVNPNRHRRRPRVLSIDGPRRN